MRFIANISLLFTEHAYLDRFAAAANAGFDAVEILWPYEETASLDQVKQAAKQAGTDIVLLNTPRGYTPETKMGVAALEGFAETFQEQLHTALSFANHLNIKHIHVLSGVTSDILAQATLIRNLRHACDQAPNQNFTIEPLSPRAMPGYFMNSFARAADVIEFVDRPNLGLQFDLFHATEMGDWRALWADFATLATHIQIGNPGNRHEPIDPIVTEFLATVVSDYAGDISAEYFPETTTEAGLGWLRDARKLF